ncbi:hypothetical protein Areg01_22150 [Actinoplanes regularis]|nr:hypothetical protein Areg01_22150 [Actinoplanes regularis]
MVDPDTSKAGVRSQTQISPSGAEAIIDISCSRTGSPRALKAADRFTAVAESMRCWAIGGQHGTSASVFEETGAGEAGFDMSRV